MPFSQTKGHAPTSSSNYPSAKCLQGHCVGDQRHKPRVPLGTRASSDTLTTAWTDSLGTTEYGRVTGKSREKPHTRVHGQHGLCLLDLGC